LQEDEWQILDEIASNFGSEDRLSLKLVFFESDQQSWKIKAEIDQVLPSRISKVLEAKRFVERRGWRGERDFMTMSVVREFAGGSFTNSRRDFLSHVDAIFSGKCLDDAWVMRSLVDRILLASKQDPSKSSYVVKRAFLLLDFYQQLSIVSTKKGSPMNSSLSEKSCYGKFVDANPNFFGTPRKRVAFLTGSLVQQVMNVQKERLGSTPFAKKLRGMRITEAMLRRLIADSKEKLRAYESDQFPQNRDLLELISDQWVASANEPELSTDEATFLFTLGMSLEYHVRQEFGREV
jgi:CRISPR-associated protein Csh1